MKQKIAIVTTLRQANKVLKTFIEYHLTIGFDYIFLFFDDEMDSGVQEVESYKNIIVFKNNDELHRLWYSTRLYNLRKDYISFISSEVMARQMLNVEVAIHKALELRIDWLLHIDIDELFYSPFISVGEHYSYLTNNGYQAVRYLNHEAIPERMKIDNYFKEVKLFKRNISTLNKSQIKFLKDTHLYNRYFNFYKTGKSATRVTLNALPTTVHTFLSENKVLNDPSILHFPCCGFSNFQNKYLLLGNFQDKWFGSYDINEIIPTHINARDVIKSNDIKLSKKFYREIIMQKDKSLINNLIDRNIYFRT